MDVLHLIQEFAVRTGIPKPTYVIGNSDPQVAQLLGLLNEAIDYIIQRFQWQPLIRQAVFTSIDGEDQGNIGVLAGAGFRYIVNDTLMNRTLRLPIFGPIGAQRWAALKTLPNSGPFYKYRISANRLLFNPPGVAGHTIAFEYYSADAVLNFEGLLPHHSPTADTDYINFYDDIILSCLRWKWKYEKGLDYAEDLRAFEEILNNTKARDGSKPVLSMDGSTDGFRPGIYVPSGNWNLS